MDTYDVSKNMNQVLRSGKYIGLSMIQEQEVLDAVRTMLARKGMK